MAVGIVAIEIYRIEPRRRVEAISLLYAIGIFHIGIMNRSGTKAILASALRLASCYNVDDNTACIAINGGSHIVAGIGICRITPGFAPAVDARELETHLIVGESLAK